MSPTRLVDGKRVEITKAEAQEAQASWELYRGPRGEPLRRKVTADGTVLEEGVETPEDLVARREREAKKQGVDLSTALKAVLQADEAVVDILVSKGVLTVEEAVAAGWTPPGQR